MVAILASSQCAKISVPAGPHGLLTAPDDDLDDVVEDQTRQQVERAVTRLSLKFPAKRDQQS
jgi:hypothetical protein